MQVFDTNILEVKIIEPSVFGDSRGYFCETFRDSEFREKVCNTTFIQDNESMSSYGVLRGLHYQTGLFSQSKLLKVVKGEILDISVDLRKGSPTFGKNVSVILSEDNKKQIFIPRGFAHGYVVLSDNAVINYKVDSYYSPEHESCIIYDDSDLCIDWKINKDDLFLSDKDKNGFKFHDVKLFNYSDKLY